MSAVAGSPIVAATIIDGLCAGVGAPALDADARRVGTRTGIGTDAFFAGLDADDRLVGTRGGAGAGAGTGGRVNAGTGSGVAAGAAAGDDGAGLDGAIVFGRAGNLIVAASDVARATAAAAIAGVGAIEVGRGGRVLCEAALMIAVDADSFGAADFGRSGRVAV